MAPKAFRRLSFRHGFATLEQFKGTNRVFFSFYYELDSWRVNQIKNMQIRAVKAITAEEKAESATRFEAPEVNSSTRTKSLSFLGIFSTISERREVTNRLGDTDSRSFRGWRVGLGNAEVAGKWGDRSNIVSANEWKSVSAGGDSAIENWIDEQLDDKACLIVLIGTETANRQWVIYEINKAWHDGKGLFGIYIHNLRNKLREQSPKGANPFERVFIDGGNLSELVETYDPPYPDSKSVYGYIQSNLNSWIAKATDARKVK